MADTNISAQMRAAVGREIGRRVSYPVSESDIRRWALAVYYPETPPRLYWDAGYADTTRHGGIVAPEEFNPFAWLARSVEPARGVDPAQNPDHLEMTLGVPGPGLKFQLNGGMAVEYGVPMRPGDVITAVNRLASYTEKEGRLGLMLFTVTEDTWTNQRGETVKRSTMTGIRY
ncbi:MaoC family dehydratase N-terminal domain-containing protein [Phytohabitans sp. ZYX-F-186]|uniref:MaoC family dehydratase N-terminal domain-containing protein n=1 Tax=Phytohabitans maris TaxID=3071409 RepID=A0ABU0ZND0_9ACTN|nr:MaoC family dehydratase N-terminal domain-containing protein [Phytohabitans sp. ZYX-F-186]MDQ7908553.1 MaoC family dehydratase N-terminal domain-containing protein [Phytohabitans sp. ZYX-F-186]